MTIDFFSVHAHFWVEQITVHEVTRTEKHTQELYDTVFDRKGVRR